MQPPPPEAVTALLHAAHQGDERAFEDLVALVYDELYRLAHVVRGPQVGATLNTTALVHEAYLQLLPSKDLAWNDRAHFFSVAARAMRQVIVRAAERRLAQKRGGGEIQVVFEEAVHGATLQAEEVIALDEAIEQLAAFAPRQARIVECRFFAGLTVEETAEALGIGSATVKRDWRTARAWLTHRLKP